MVEPEKHDAPPTAKAKQLALVVAELKAAPEAINPATKLYYHLYLEYTFGNLDIGELLLQKDKLTATLETGKDALEEGTSILSKLKALPSRSSYYVPL